MNMKKILALGLCAVLLVGGSVLGTMAYLTDTAEVTNTFSVGNVDITLDEAKVDVYGEADATVARVTENSYKLIPGHSYTKDPIVHVTVGSEKCWLFVEIDNAIADIEDATTIAAQMATNGWALVDGETNVYAYNAIVDASAVAVDVPVFATFKIKGDADVAAYDKATITVTAYAVQADSFETAAAAWAATFGA